MNVPWEYAPWMTDYTHEWTDKDLYEYFNLTPKEIDLLFYMVKNRNIALSRERLLEEVWDIDYFGEDRTVDTHIKMLRHNLGPYRDFILTVRGMGYKFEA